MADSRQCSRSPFPRRWLARTAPRALVSSLLLAGCAERYEIGELGAAPEPPQPGPPQPGPPQPEPNQAGHFVDTLLASDVDDGDAVADQELSFRAAVGDLDGDGHDDWVTQDGKLIYGGPRPLDGVLRVPSDVAQFPYSQLSEGSIVGVGDVNGDGFADLLFNSGETSGAGWEEADLDGVRATCSGQRAYLWYGRPERLSGMQDLSVSALAFGDPDDLAAQLTSEIIDLMPGSTGYNVRCELELAPAGDLNGDGYADLSLSTRFEYKVLNGDSPDVRAGALANTYLLYGHAGRGRSQAEELSAAAQLAGVDSIVALGDVDGDGYGDLLLRPASYSGNPQAARLLPGSTERLQGQVPVTQLGVPLLGFGINYGQGVAIGDLDGDGMQDFLIKVYQTYGPPTVFGDLVHFIFYGGPDRTHSPVEADRADAILRVPVNLGWVNAAGDWQGDGFDDLSLALAIHPSSEELFRGDADTSPEHLELRARAYDWEAVELHLLSGGSARMSGTYAPPVFRPDLTPPLTPIRTLPERHLYPGGPIGDFDGDGRADLTFSVSASGRPGTAFIKYGAPLPPSTPPLH